jgi:hypothetical protein
MQDEMKYFIGVITKQVVERHLVAPFAGIISPLVMASYSDNEIQLLAVEPPEAVER